jgi:DNA-directed RNA polymerase specialized sigma24 family protein
MAQATGSVVLTTERHYAPLRDAVWLRMISEDPRMPWAAFEDAYQEVWAWVSAQPSPVTVESGSPVAYLAQAVRRRYVDELRTRKRGLGRDAAGPVIEALDDHADRIASPGPEDGDDAREARRAVSAIYLMARERLSRRELQAFALSYVLEMRPAEAAQAMGVSAKRFRNLRWDGWRKVGDEVVSLLEGRLHWCDSEEAAGLRARALAGDAEAFGPLRVHLACCAACSHSMADARRAAAVVLPLPLILDEPSRALSLFDGLFAFLSRPTHRAAELAGAFPATGRSAAAVVAVAAVAGGGSTVVAHDPEPEPVRAGTEAPVLARAVPAVIRRADSAPRAVATAAPARVARRRVRARPNARPGRAKPVPARKPDVVPLRAPPVAQPATAPPPSPSGEFGFE